MKRRDFVRAGVATSAGAMVLKSTPPASAQTVSASSSGLAVVNGRGRKDIVVASFDGADWGEWTSTGEAFGAGPVVGPAQLARAEVAGYRGEGVASSERDGDSPTGAVRSPSFTIRRRFLSFAIGGGDYEYVTCLHLVVGGVVVKSATGRRSDRLDPASWDVSEWEGRSARIQIVDEAKGGWGHVIVDHIVQTDDPERQPVVTDTLYAERHRPQFHFTARQFAMDRLNPDQRQEGWLNDLNGLIYYEGEYHLFAQRWNKCWIHAVSPDLFHWTELAPAFFEESLDVGVQSGTCVIDYDNTSGLAKSAKSPAMVAFWSRNDNATQCLSYSLDRGRTWTFYPGNPVLTHAERDPKVFWYEPGKHWVMLLYVDQRYRFLRSPDLLTWTDTGNSVPGYECPDFFEMPIDGDRTNTTWVLVRGDGNYTMGTFDGTRFVEETELLGSDTGPHFYATQTWENTATGDGRRIQTAWMRGGSYPDMPFNQQVSLPCELTLQTTPDGPRMFRRPVKELRTLRRQEKSWRSRTLRAGEAWDLEVDSDLLHLEIQVAVPPGAELTIDVRGARVQIGQNSITNGGNAQRVRDRLHSIELVVDRTSIEAFANDGELSLSRCFLPSRDGITLRTTGGPATIKSLKVAHLASTWKHRTG